MIQPSPSIEPVFDELIRKRLLNEKLLWNIIDDPEHDPRDREPYVWIMDLMKLLNKRRRRLVLGFTVMDNKIIDSRDAGLRESGGYKPKSYHEWVIV